MIGVNAWAQPASQSSEPLEFTGVKVGTFPQEVRTFYTTADGLPDDAVTGVAIAGDTVYASTAKGLARFQDGAWEKLEALSGPVALVQSCAGAVVAVAGQELLRVDGDDVTVIGAMPAQSGEVTSLCGNDDTIWAGTSTGLWVINVNKDVVPVEPLNMLLGIDKSVRQVTCTRGGQVAVAAQAGLFHNDRTGKWQRLYPSSREKSWAPVDVRGVAFDREELLWFASPEGVGRCQADDWILFAGRDGLPYNDFTTIAVGDTGTVWFGTKMGAIRYDGSRWAYREGPSWLPGDDVRAIAVNANGDAWIATDKGVGLIEQKPMTLAQKADYFNEELDKYNRRTPYGYVLEASLATPGDKSTRINHDSDNDGLWTAMYGASECYRYAATKDPVAKERATKAFEALRFLSEVTQGGEHPAPPGFPARSILPTDGSNPNDHATPERDREKQQQDPAWKVLDPRWPVSADGKWYWKTDTSSDELDGHYFFYALYYDLVAETEAEKTAVRDTTLAITDHLIAHDYALVDHDGKPTRWAQYGPDCLNYDMTSGGRGLNSVSILTYLKIAEHMSGDAKYERAYRDLIDKHAYAMNTLIPKTAMGPGTGNQSDDEMAFMGYYHLLRYETDPELLRFYTRSLFQYWQLEQRELCPLFNYIFAACLEGKNLGMFRRYMDAGFLNEALDSLKRYRMDRIEWPIKNSQRIDVTPLSSGVFGRGNSQGCLVSGKVLPIDERNVNHWNHSPWQLDYGGNGTELTDGAAFLLPYYMGLYHGYIVEK